MPPSVSPEGLTSSLPRVPLEHPVSSYEDLAMSMLGYITISGVELFLSGVESGGENRACEVAAKLMPKSDGSVYQHSCNFT